MSVVFWLTIIGVACWPVCFYWMWRISVRQDALLSKLGDQAARIEELSRAEHDLIREVHPNVDEIRENVEKVTAAVGEEPSRKSG